MKNLYIDFDGVIMTTNTKIDTLLNQNKVDKSNYEECMDFLKNLKWDKLLSQSEEISNAFFHLNNLANSGRYNVSILTHVCSDHEAEAKKNIINEKVGNIQVIPVPKNHEKCNFVNPKGAVLVDDYTKNLELWEENGGIGIKFTNKEYDKFKSTYNLGELFDII